VTSSLAADLARHPEVARLRDPLARAAGDTPVYLVGGAVRDLLLGAGHVDVDLVVDGDAVPVARALARETGERLVVHDAFGTAVVGDVDLATARAERYAEPGALPEVWPATLAEDLVRRDFSINAMAVALVGEPFGTLRDPLGGWADLVAGTVRVLHGRSFRDDPTRILRAARYVTRFGFGLDEATAEQARATARADLVTTVGGPRLRDALLLLLREEAAGAALVLLESLGVLHAIAPGLHADAVRFEELDELAALAPDVDRTRARLALLVRSLPAVQRRRLLAWLRLRRTDDRIVGYAADARPERLDDLPDEAALVVGGAAARRWLEHDRHVRLEVDGTDLARELGLAPGPEVGRLLRALLAEKRAGRLPDRDAELARARALVS
jgi:tRNA nucleotidyltransferase (CCA-adding enzyme)